MKEFYFHKAKKTVQAETMFDAQLIMMFNEPEIEIDPGPPFCDKLPLVKSDTYTVISNRKGKTHRYGYVPHPDALKNPAKWKKLKAKVFKRDKHKCVRCDSKRSLTAHHLKPRSEGGKDVMHNLKTLCVSCHDWAEEHQPKRIRRIRT